MERSSPEPVDLPGTRGKENLRRGWKRIMCANFNSSVLYQVVLKRCSLKELGVLEGWGVHCKLSPPPPLWSDFQRPDCSSRL